MTPVEEIKQRLDIAEFIRAHVKLEKSGQNWRALCPFHAEKTPSFFVSPSRQTWHCFGACSEGGDVFSFLMKIEHIEFPEALRILAEKAGVKLSREDPKIRSERNRLSDILERAAQFYEKKLEEAESPRNYLLRERSLNESTVKTFRLGWAPEGWRNILEYLTREGFSQNEIERAGLVIRKIDEGGGFYDRFRSRIMFPLFDGMGRVVGFTGRVFASPSATSAEKETAKYINTPETPLFQKSKLLYGWHASKSAINQKGAALLVEGQMDFLAAWQEEVKNAVATSGTALAETQLQTLKRLTNTLILGFDMDAAGDNATERGILLAARMGFDIRILSLPEGKDVADFAKTHPGKLEGLLEKSRHLMEYYFAKAARTFPLETIEGKKRAVWYVMPRLKTLASPAERALWLQKFSEMIGIKEEFLQDELVKAPSLIDGAAKFAEIQSVQSESGRPTKTRKDMLAERALAFSLKHPAAAPIIANSLIYFPSAYAEFARGVAEGRAAEETNAELANYLFLRGDYELSLRPDIDLPSEVQLCLRELQKEFIHRRLSELTRALKDAETKNDTAASRVLSEEFSKLAKELKVETA